MNFDQIVCVKFGLFSNEEILRYCVCEIFKHKVLGNDTKNTLFDRRLGVFDVRSKCQTCNEDIKKCQGHCGYIKLAKPIYHPSYVTDVKRLFEIFCFDCKDFKRKLPAEVFSIEDPEERFKKIHKLSKGISRCQHSTKDETHRVYNFKADKNQILKSNMVSKMRKNPQYAFQEFFIDDVVNFIESIPAEKLKMAGFDLRFTHPRSFIMNYLVVPPPNVRPSIMYSINRRSEDDITKKYQRIIQMNENIKKMTKVSTAFSVIRDNYDNLCFEIFTLFNNKRSDIPESTTRREIPFKCYHQRLSGKEGRMRGNLSGRRVDFCARAVITPDPYISLDEIGLPKYVADTLTKEVSITRYNIKYYQELLDQYFNDDNQLIKGIFVGEKCIVIDKIGEGTKLEIGMVIERGLINGDVILLNRQPTLHKESMNAHKVVIYHTYGNKRKLTFGLNPAICGPYNADFDGDCMVIHVPCDSTVESELLNISLISKNIISSQNNSPNIGLIQDGIIGAYVLSTQDVFLDKKEFFRCISQMDNFDYDFPEPEILKPKPLWTGKQLLSAVIPEITIFKKQVFNDDDVIDFEKVSETLRSKKYIRQADTESSIIDCFRDIVLNHFIWLPFIRRRFAEVSKMTWIFTPQEVQGILNEDVNGLIGEADLLRKVYGGEVEIRFNKDTSKLIVLPDKRSVKDHLLFKFPNEMSFKIRKFEIEQDDVYLNELELKRFLKEGINFGDEKISVGILKMKRSGLFPQHSMMMDGKKLWSMKSMLELCIGTTFIPRDKYLHIEKGVLISGVLDKKVVGRSNKSLIHYIANEISFEIAKVFVNSLQKVILEYQKFRPYTISIKDCIVNNKIKDNIVVNLKKVKEDYQELTKISNSQNKEEAINNFLNNTRSMIGKTVCDNIEPTNNLKRIVDCGSKGNLINIAQINGCLGQQNVFGGRIKPNEVGRTIPYYEKGDTTAESKGFVSSSYIHGLNPQEYFFHHMGGREGMTDTGIKTSESGHIQRQLSTTLEDYKVEYDNTVRDGKGRILEFTYGDDGFDGKYLQRVKIPFHKFNKEMFDKVYKWDQSSDYTNFEYSQLLVDRDNVVNFKKMFEDKMGYHVLNMGRIIRKAKSLFNITDKTETDLTPEFVIKSILKYCNWVKKNQFFKFNFETLEDVEPVIDNFNCQSNGSFREEINSCATFMTRIILRFFLASKYLIEEHKITVECFRWIIYEVNRELLGKKVEPGEMVGPLAAQSIGEPATQMTLNTFHYAGVSQKNITLGIPKLKELLNVKKKPSAPSMEIYTSGDVGDDIFSRIEEMRFGDFVESEFIFEEDPNKRDVVQEDSESLETYFSLYKIEYHGKYVLRFTLIDQELCDLTVDFVADKIRKKYPDLVVVDSFDNIDEMFIRIYAKHEDNDNKDYLRNRINEIKDISISGIEGVKTVYKEGQCYTTNGSNLREVSNLSFVDEVNTISNNINEVYEVYGIEAARNVMLKEIRELFDVYGSYINYRHLNLLCNKMSFEGVMIPIGRNGLRKTEAGVFKNAIFAMPVKTFEEAAKFSKEDDLTDVGSQLCNGNIPRIGTGVFDVMLDLEGVSKIYELSEWETETTTQEKTPYPNKTPYHRNSQRTPFTAMRTPFTTYDQIGEFSPSNYRPQSPDVDMVGSDEEEESPRTSIGIYNPFSSNIEFVLPDSRKRELTDQSEGPRKRLKFTDIPDIF